MYIPVPIFVALYILYMTENKYNRTITHQKPVHYFFLAISVLICFSLSALKTVAQCSDSYLALQVFSHSVGMQTCQSRKRSGKAEHCSSQVFQSVEKQKTCAHFFYLLPKGPRVPADKWPPDSNFTVKNMLVNQHAQNQNPEASKWTSIRFLFCLCTCVFFSCDVNVTSVNKSQFSWLSG